MIGKRYAVKKKIKQEKMETAQMSFSLLQKMATTKRLKEILLNHIEKETIPSVRTAWVEYFLDIKNKKILVNKR